MSEWQEPGDVDARDVVARMTVLDLPLEPVSLGADGDGPDVRGVGWVARVDAEGRLDCLIDATEGPGRPTLADPVVVVAAPLTMRQVVRGWAFTELGDPLPRGAAVVVRDDFGFVGVLAGEDLAEIAYASTVRAILDADPLPSMARIAVPLLVRRCRYVEASGGQARCGRSETFAQRPETMPECPDALGIPAHTFKW